MHSGLTRQPKLISFDLTELFRYAQAGAQPPYSPTISSKLTHQKLN
jgi:hypothetical protein